MTTESQACMRCGLSHPDPSPLEYPDAYVYRCLRALAAEIPAAVKRERERVARIIESAEVVGYYDGRERFVPDMERTLAIVAERIRSEQ